MSPKPKAISQDSSLRSNTFFTVNCTPNHEEMRVVANMLILCRIDYIYVYIILQYHMSIVFGALKYPLVSCRGHEVRLQSSCHGLTNSNSLAAMKDGDDKECIKDGNNAIIMMVIVLLKVPLSFNVIIMMVLRTVLRIMVTTRRSIRVKVNSIIPMTIVMIILTRTRQIK